MTDKAAQMREVVVHLQNNGVMPMITVYERPDDYPNGYVARIFIVERGNPEPRPTGYVCYAKRLYDLRQQIPQELVKMPRQEGDFPSILETWF